MTQNWKISYARDAKKDCQKLKSMPPAIKRKFLNLQENLIEDPYLLPYKEVKEFPGCRCVRINSQHRLIYKIFHQEKIIRIISILGHYDD